jgi:hypothetical protein
MTPEIIARIDQNVGTRASRLCLSCCQAFQIAAEFKISIQEIGHWCNKHGIKICECQLGCF